MYDLISEGQNKEQTNAMFGYFFEKNRKLSNLNAESRQSSRRTMPHGVVVGQSNSPPTDADIVFQSETIEQLSNYMYTKLRSCLVAPPIIVMLITSF